VAVGDGGVPRLREQIDPAYSPGGFECVPSSPHRRRHRRADKSTVFTEWHRVCRGCANVDAGPVPVAGDQQQQQQQVPDGDDSVMPCWRTDDDASTCCPCTPQHRPAPRTSPAAAAAGGGGGTAAPEHLVSITPWQTST